MNKLAIIGLTLLGIGIIMFEVDMVLGDSLDRDLCKGQFAQDVDCFNIIIDQNESIIEKLDWNNCILKHKDSHGYSPPEQGWVSINYDDLVKLCGEMP